MARKRKATTVSVLLHCVYSGADKSWNKGSVVPLPEDEAARLVGLGVAEVVQPEAVDDTVVGDDTVSGDDTVVGDDTVPGDDTVVGDDTVPGDDTVVGDDTVPGDDTVVTEETKAT